jgi:hypothetical protein
MPGAPKWSLSLRSPPPQPCIRLSTPHACAELLFPIVDTHPTLSSGRHFNVAFWTCRVTKLSCLPNCVVVRVQMKCDGTRWRTGGGVKGKLVNGVGSQYPSLPRNMVYPALLPLMRTPWLPVLDWTGAPTDLNGFVRFAERRNLVSARVPSHFKRSLQYDGAAVRSLDAPGSCPFRISLTIPLYSLNAWFSSRSSVSAVNYTNRLQFILNIDRVFCPCQLIVCNLCIWCSVFK